MYLTEDLLCHLIASISGERQDESPLRTVFGSWQCCSIVFHSYMLGPPNLRMIERFDESYAVSSHLLVNGDGLAVQELMRGQDIFNNIPIRNASHKCWPCQQYLDSKNKANGLICAIKHYVFCDYFGLCKPSISLAEWHPLWTLTSGFKFHHHLLHHLCSAGLNSFLTSWCRHTHLFYTKDTGFSMSVAISSHTPSCQVNWTLQVIPCSV